VPESDRLRVLASLARKQAVVLGLKVVPRAGKSEVVDQMGDGTWRVRLAAVPEKGKANEELRALLARYLDIRKEQVELVSGATSTHKRVRIRPS
jgi:uncharacterized protein (TIGR00251 family)